MASNGVAVFKTKLVSFFGRDTSIVLENGGGSSLLVSICNVLLLRGNVQLDVTREEVSQEDLMSLVMERVMDLGIDDQVAEMLNLLPHMVTGIHVDICFTGINDYEPIQERSMFDVLDIGLYHGFLVDPQDIETASIIASESYSSILRFITSIETIGQRRGDIEEAETLLKTLKLSQKEMYFESHLTGENCIFDPGDQTFEDQESDDGQVDYPVPEYGKEEKYQVMKNFLDSCPSQLTDYGLFLLTESLIERELCIFVCNNHFSTMLKYNGKLYLLETPESYRNQKNLVWAKLSKTRGETMFMTGSLEEFKGEKQDDWSEEEVFVNTLDQIRKLQDSQSADSTSEFRSVARRTARIDAAVRRPIFPRAGRALLIFCLSASKNSFVFLL